MPQLYCSLAALTVATIFYAYRAYHDAVDQRERTLRERVAYMLWVMANRASS